MLFVSPACLAALADSKSVPMYLSRCFSYGQASQDEELCIVRGESEGCDAMCYVQIRPLVLVM